MRVRMRYTRVLRLALELGVRGRTAEQHNTTHARNVAEGRGRQRREADGRPPNTLQVTHADPIRTASARATRVGATHKQPTPHYPPARSRPPPPSCLAEEERGPTGEAVRSEGEAARASTTCESASSAQLVRGEECGLPVR